MAKPMTSTETAAVAIALDSLEKEKMKMKMKTEWRKDEVFCKYLIRTGQTVIYLDMLDEGLFVDGSKFSSRAKLIENLHHCWLAGRSELESASYKNA